MGYHRTDLLDLIDEYGRIVGFVVSNRATHIVTEDYNLDDDQLEFALKWIEENHADLLKDDIRERDIITAVAFLNFLKTLPEELRQGHWDGDD